VFNAVVRVLEWLFRRSPPAPPPTPSVVEEPSYRLRVPKSIIRELREVSQPNAGRGEPLTFLRARFVSEDSRTIMVGISVVPFPEGAYVDGPAEANFDTGWAVDFANEQIGANVGLMLVHSHGGNGMPNFSGVDTRTNRSVMAALAIGNETVPYGAVVLSDSDARGVVAVASTLKDVHVVAVPDFFGKVSA